MAHIRLTRGAQTALICGHVAGMIDLAALPLWLEALITGYQYRPSLAGMLPTAFLAGVVLASVLLARHSSARGSRILAPLAYWIAGVALFAVPLARDFALHLLLHFTAGFAAGLALSTIHGAMGRSVNPHRIFSYAGIGLGFFSLIFLGGVPQLTNLLGPDAVFLAIGAAMCVAGLATAVAMPAAPVPQAEAAVAFRAMPRHVRYAIAGIMGMALVQGMVFSFLVQAGSARGFAASRIEAVLIVLGIINLVAPALAAFAERRLSAITVARAGPLVQFSLAATIMFPTPFFGYAIAAACFASVMIFTHTFVFGFIAKQDTSGRAVAATPAMLMTGSAIAPFLGGMLIELVGFPALAILAGVIGASCFMLFSLAGHQAALEAAVESI